MKSPYCKLPVDDPEVQRGLATLPTLRTDTGGVHYCRAHPVKGCLPAYRGTSLERKATQWRYKGSVLYGDAPGACWEHHFSHDCSKRYSERVAQSATDWEPPEGVEIKEVG